MLCNYTILYISSIAGAASEVPKINEPTSLGIFLMGNLTFILLTGAQYLMVRTDTSISIITGSNYRERKPWQSL